MPIGYEQAFRATFKEDYPEFTVGHTLKGIVLDWSHNALGPMHWMVGQ